MAKMIQMRNVPDDLHRKLKARAALAGMSLSDYLLREVRHIAEKPTMEEMMKRIEKAEAVITRMSPAQILREEREKRGRR
jgi:plasmid stability protein